MSACPVCSSATAFLLRRHGVDFRRCPSCTHQFADLAVSASHVDEVYGDAYFDGGGAGYPDYLAEGELIRRHGLRYARIVSAALGLSAPGAPDSVSSARRQVLDVGSAAGFILQGFTDGGWRGVGIEPNPAMARHARERLGLDVRCATLESPASALLSLDDSTGRFDLVSMVQVAAHFHDLSRAFGNAARLTAPDGCWLIETWDNASWTARVLGAGWHEYSPPSVLQVFSRASLSRLCAAHGFEPVAFGRPRKYLSGAHVRSLLSFKAQDGVLGRVLAGASALLPAKMAFRYPAEDLFWGLFRRAGASGAVPLDDGKV